MCSFHKGRLLSSQTCHLGMIEGVVCLSGHLAPLLYLTLSWTLYTFLDTFTVVTLILSSFSYNCCHSFILGSFASFLSLLLSYYVKSFFVNMLDNPCTVLSYSCNWLTCGQYLVAGVEQMPLLGGEADVTVKPVTG